MNKLNMFFEEINVPNVGMVFPFKKLNLFDNSKSSNMSNRYVYKPSNRNVSYVDAVNPILETRLESVPQTVIMRPERIEATVVEPRVVMDRYSFQTEVPQYRPQQQPPAQVIVVNNRRDSISSEDDDRCRRHNKYNCRKCNVYVIDRKNEKKNVKRLPVITI